MRLRAQPEFLEVHGLPQGPWEDPAVYFASEPRGPLRSSLGGSPQLWWDLVDDLFDVCFIGVYFIAYHVWWCLLIFAAFALSNSAAKLRTPATAPRTKVTKQLTYIKSSYIINYITERLMKVIGAEAQEFNVKHQKSIKITLKMHPGAIENTSKIEAKK